MREDRRKLENKLDSISVGKFGNMAQIIARKNESPYLQPASPISSPLRKSRQLYNENNSGYKAVPRDYMILRDDS